MPDTMDASVAQFNKEMLDFAKTLVPKQMIAFQKKIAFELLKRIVEKTPVDTGRARANWQVSINKRAKGTITFSKKKRLGGLIADRNRASVASKAANEALSSGKEIIDAQVTPTVETHLTNNLNYISFLEEGTSQQAPSGMVKLSLQEMTAIFR